ncbi:SGNH/GDSL hydrolase family protein [Allocoleopsis franciscana]|uniref:Phospholipase/lecithinase/hemolysin n=1 Tax=Allocoleopsis franciscana PCC 7113 TaxID=1173027 RepID=K9WEA7_9CYAN|nr:SGNH/GDSL hydrolase family protein [Allocoleopsis franciscana]AFZ18126.1 phospholipase/lecithinase/hemolysin [Allocoleopsis franciscana PCC 7113]
MNKQIAATGFVLFSFLLPLKAAAATFTQMYVFGDSLSDTGNAFNATLQAIGAGSPPPPYFNGRFSNGPNWIDYLGQDLNLNPTPYTALAPATSPTQGINFAFGGSTTGLDNTINPNLPGLQQQIGLFASLIPANQTADPNALYVLWAGANDYLPTQSSFTPFTTPETTIGNLSFALSTLAALGAKNFLVANLPDLGSLPLTSTTPISDNLNNLVSLHNSSLNTTLNTFSQAPGSDLNIKLLDVNSLFKGAISNPAQYGFTNVTEACINNLNCVLGSQTVQAQYLFWDNIHPTTVTHQEIAKLAFDELETESVPEPATIVGTVIFGALAIGWKLKKKSQPVS